MGRFRNERANEGYDQSLNLLISNVETIYSSPFNLMVLDVNLPWLDDADIRPLEIVGHIFTGVQR
jgi:hypothetical protein